MADIKKVIISVVPIGAMKDSSIGWMHYAQAEIAAGRPHPGARRVYATEELLWEAITPKRLAILKAIGGRGPMSIRQAARLAGRDVKAVHGDIQKLIEKRLIEKTDDGRIEFPFSEIHLDVVLKTAQDVAA